MYQVWWPFKIYEKGTFIGDMLFVLYFVEISQDKYKKHLSRKYSHIGYKHRIRYKHTHFKIHYIIIDPPSKAKLWQPKYDMKRPSTQPLQYTP